jgi:hypothetical protein
VRHWAALFLAALLSACGGAVPVSGPIVPVTTLRADLKFGYYFGNPLYMVEQADHVNLWWAVSQGPVWFLDMAAQLQQARGNPNIKNVVLHLNTTDPTELRFQFGKVSEMGYLAGWDSITVYPMDEPDASGLSDADVTAKMVAIRQVMFDTPGLLTAKLGVFYGCASGKRPGIKSFDLVGCFRYEASGCAKLESDYATLRSQLSPGAKLWLLPGGAFINGKEGRQDPACWASYAHRNLDVWGAPAFMWQGGADPKNTIVGIREQADMRRLYCETGRTILRPDEAPRC